MKKKLFKCIVLYCLTTCNLYVYAQGKSESNISILQFKENFFFEQVHYPLTVDIKDSTDYIIIEGDESSTISKDSNNTYNVVFHGNKRRSTITVSKIIDGKKDKIFSKEFYFKSLPITPFLMPTQSLPGNKISKEKLKGAFLSAGQINYDIDIFFQVVSYTMIFTKNDSVIKFKISGAKIDNEHYKYLENLKSGQPIIFDDIYIKGIEAFNIKIYPLIIYIE